MDEGGLPFDWVPLSIRDHLGINKRDLRGGKYKEEEPDLLLDRRSIVLMLPRQGGVD